MRRLVLSLSVAALAAACSSQKSGPEKKGPFVAEGNGVAVSAEEFKARLDEQSPFIRSRYTTIERKKEFLDNLVRFEVLAKEAERLLAVSVDYARQGQVALLRQRPPAR